MYTRDRCRTCGRPLTNSTSRRFGIGPCCRSGMSANELADALTRQHPGHIPPERRPSTTARLNNHHARQAARTPGTQETCARHGGIVGVCPNCREENDPLRAAARIVYDIRRERRILRDAGHAPDARAATSSGVNYPPRRDLPPPPPRRPRAPTKPTGPQQLEIT